MARQTKADLLAEIDSLKKQIEGYKKENMEVLRLENLGLLHHIEMLKKTNIDYKSCYSFE